jgi:hypothetical protein
MKDTAFWKRFAVLIAVVAVLGAAAIISHAGAGCSSSGAPPLSIPAPTSGYVTVTAPDESGNAHVYGFIVADGAVVPNATVTITNTTASVSVNTEKGLGKSSSTVSTTTTTGADGSFSAQIAASTGDSIVVTYTDPASGQESDPLTTTVTGTVEPMSSTTMVPRAVDMGADGYAYLVANDGTNSEIIKVNMLTGALTRATFAGKKFDKIAVHSGMNYAAVLDTANKAMYWYNLANLANELTASGSAAFSSIIYDVAVVDLGAAGAVTDDFIAVSHDIADYGFFTTYAINSSTGALYAGRTSGNCISHPSDTSYYPLCMIGVSNPSPLRATKIDLIADSGNLARMTLVAEYNNAGTTDKYAHFIHFDQFGTDIYFSSSQTYRSVTVGSAADPYQLAWYNDMKAAFTDQTAGTLVKLYDDGSTLTATSLTLSTGPRGLYPDSANTRLFAAEQGTDKVLNVDMANFVLSGTSYSAIYDPTGVVYYTDGTSHKIGVITTSPEPAFHVISAQ